MSAMNLMLVRAQESQFCTIRVNERTDLAVNRIIQEFTDSMLAGTCSEFVKNAHQYMLDTNYVGVGGPKELMHRVARLQKIDPEDVVKRVQSVAAYVLRSIQEAYLFPDEKLQALVEILTDIKLSDEHAKLFMEAQVLHEALNNTHEQRDEVIALIGQSDSDNPHIYSVLHRNFPKVIADPDMFSSFLYHLNVDLEGLENLGNAVLLTCGNVASFSSNQEKVLLSLLEKCQSSRVQLQCPATTFEKVCGFSLLAGSLTLLEEITKSCQIDISNQAIKDLLVDEKRVLEGEEGADSSADELDLEHIEQYNGILQKFLANRQSPEEEKSV